MPIKLHRENEQSKVVPVRISNVPKKLGAANIQSVEKKKTHFRAPPPRHKSRPKRPVESSDDSDSDSDGSEGGMGADPTLSALSNPSKTNNVPMEADFANPRKRKQVEESDSDDSDDDEGPSGGGGGGGGDDSSEDNDSGSEDSGSDDGASDSGSEDSNVGPDGKKLSRKEIDKLKADFLAKFDRLRKSGHTITKKFTMKSSLKDMQREFERINTGTEVDGAIKFQRKALVAILSGIEFLNTKFDPFNIKLTGWTESVLNDIEDYNSVFEKLFFKYRGSSEVAPEIELMMMIAGSALMFHMSKSLFNNSNFNINDILKQNPELMKNLMNQFQQTNSFANGGTTPIPTPNPGQTAGGNDPNQPATNPSNNNQTLIEEIDDRLSESSFESNVTGVKSVSIRVDPNTSAKGRGRGNAGKPKRVMDIQM